MTLHDFFFYAALLGGALFLVQLVLSVIGAGDADIDLDVGSHAHPGDHTSSDVAFKLLSLQGLSSFFTIFGLAGLALNDQSRTPPYVSLAGAFAAGWLTTALMARIFRAAKRLEASGTLDLKNAQGQEATVYLRIAPNKRGKVSVTVQGRLVEAEAVSHDTTFETGERVRVLRALPDGSLLVGKPEIT